MGAIFIPSRPKLITKDTYNVGAIRKYEHTDNLKAMWK